MSYRKVAALYFDTNTRPEQRAAFTKLVASFFPDRAAAFSRVRSCHIGAHSATEGSLSVQIPGVLDMQIDRMWGRVHRSLPFVAASDYYANTIQYAQNVRYRMTDVGAGLVFDYSHRQANYRVLDLDVEQYRSKSMLVQFLDGSGWFTAPQLSLIADQNLMLPDLVKLRRDITGLKTAGQEPQ